MSWAAVFVCLLQPLCLSGIIMPNPTRSTSAPNLQNDITLLTQTVTSLQSTTGQLKSDLLAAKSDLMKDQQTIQLIEQQSAAEIASLKAEIQTMKSKLQQSSDELNQAKSDLDNMKQNVSLIEHQQTLGDIERQSSKVLANNVSIHIEQLEENVTSSSSDVRDTRQDLQSVKEQVFNLSKNLASKTRDVAFHVSLLEGEQPTYTPLPFSKILYNAGDGYNLTSGTFTAPVSGTYMFWTQIENIQPSTYMNIWIMKTGRGDILSSGWVETDTSISDAVANAQTVQHLNSGEEVWVEITVEHILKDSDASYFGGVLLSVD